MNMETLVDLLYNHRCEHAEHPQQIGLWYVQCACALSFNDHWQWARHVAEEVKLLEQEERQ